MSQICELTGKRPSTGHSVSHAKNATNRWWAPNLKIRTYELPKLGKTVTLKLSTKAIRTIDKHGGIESAIRKSKDGVISDRVLRLKKDLKKAFLGKNFKYPVAAAATK
jgi:large subunit ribosomal protein L28